MTTRTVYRKCSCGAYILASNRKSQANHRRKGHTVPMKHYTESEIMGSSR